MSTLSKTTLAKPDLVKKWYVIDADGAVLGRLAVQIANLLRGRNKAIYTPHIDTGDFVIVINAEKVRLTGDKEEKKVYEFYSGWQGGQKTVPVEAMRAKRPEYLIENAVRGMLPKNRLASAMFTKMKVYAGASHPHAAQNPIKFEI